MMTTYRLGSPLPSSERVVAFGAVLAHISLAVEHNHVLAAHDADPGLDADVQIHTRRRRWVQNATHQGFDPERLLRRRGRSEGDVVAMSHDASGGVDGDGLLLLDWLLAHGFGPGSSRVRSACGGGAAGEQGVEEGAGLGWGEGGWCGVGGVGGLDCHGLRGCRWDGEAEVGRRGFGVKERVGG